MNSENPGQGFKGFLLCRNTGLSGNAGCGVRGAECGNCGVYKMRSVENAECGKCGVRKMRSVENAECGKRGVWKMRSVANAECGKFSLIV